MAQQVKIIINPMNEVIEVSQGAIMLDAIRKAGINIRSICGGEGECATCKVIINKGEVSCLSNKSNELLSPQEISENYHLACQIRILSDCEVTIPVESRVALPKILLNEEMSIKYLNPDSKKYLLTVSRSQDDHGCRVNLKGYSGPSPNVSENLCNKLSAMNELTTATISMALGPEIIDVEPGDRTGSNYGLAIDIGTTTIVALLVDLTNGRIVAKASALNKQITYGETLITRIAFSRKAENGLQKLQQTIIQTINDLIDRLVSKIGISNLEISSLSAGGNTVMNHLLAGTDVDYLWYVDANDKVSRAPIIKKSKELGLRTNPEAYIYCLPNVSRFLGGDAIGDVLVSDMHDSDEISLLVDMGTNGEIIFGNKQWFVSCSVASGPAFEGSGIRFGMRAMNGAIEHVKVDPESYKASYAVLGNKKPKGICGSGIIDIATELFRVGIFDFRGKIVKAKTERVREGRHGLEYVIVPAEETAIGRDITITQRDMDYLIDSKAATLGGILVLMRKFNFSIHDVKKLYLAGAFGMYTDLKNVTELGIFPEFPNAEICPIGNGSLSGAYRTLLSIEEKEKAKEITQNMLYIDLLTDVMFAEAYSESIYIPGPKALFPSLAKSK